MSNKQIIINIGSSILISWVIFELLTDKKYRSSLKNQLLNIIDQSRSEKYKDYYYRDINLINDELNSIKNDEKNHTIKSFKKTFIYRSSSNLESYIRYINLYGKMRNSKNDDLIFQQTKQFSNYLISIDKMLWFPHFFRYIFTIFNYQVKLRWNYKHSFEKHDFGKYFSYIIKPSNKKYERTIIIFIGLGGILNPFDNIIDLLIKNNYQIIIPIYGPSQASLDYNINCHEAEFHEELYNLVNELDVTNIEIMCWSLGGILYKGFENYVNNCHYYNLNIYNENVKIDRVFLFEPLIGIRASADTFFSQIRSYNNTISLMHSVTNKRYFVYNYIFSYFMHTIIGFSTCVSFGFFSTVELKNISPSFFHYYPRYLFLSSDDFVINDNLDKELIKNNFSEKNIYRRNGYHGGWLFSNKLIPILEKII
jgi:hypothetical protein